MVDRPAQSLGRDLRLIGVEVNDLPLGVDAGVGAGGADGRHGVADDGRQRRCQHFLDGRDASESTRRSALWPALVGRLAPAASASRDRPCPGRRRSACSVAWAWSLGQIRPGLPRRGLRTWISRSGL